MACHPVRRLRGYAVSALVFVYAVGCGGSQVAVRPQVAPTHPDEFYPLAGGNAWSYDVDSGDGESVLAVSRVVSATGNQVEVLAGGGKVLRYERRADGIYRPHRSSYLLQGPVEVGRSWQSGAASATVTRAVPKFETPAGVFEGCVEVAETGLPGGQRVETTYCPGVGPAQVISSMEVRGQTLTVTARLRGYQVQPPAP